MNNDENNVSQPLTKKDLNRNASQAAILKAARDLFAEKGFDGTTTKEIAQKSGCAEGLIFKYYKNKQALFARLLEEWHEYNIKQLQNLEQHQDSLEEELYNIIKWSFKQYQLSSKLTRIAISQRFMSQQPEELLQHRKLMFAERAALIIEKLTYHQQHGRIAENIDLNQIHTLINSYALVEVIFKDTTLSDIEQLTHSLVKVILSGIAKE